MVRAELDPYAGLRLTVTVVPDVSRPPPVRHSSDVATVDAALDQVRGFLTAFAGGTGAPVDGVSGPRDEPSPSGSGM